MKKNKTVLKELLEWLEDNKFHTADENGGTYVDISYSEVKNKIQELISEERKQIIDAYSIENGVYNSGEDYFEKTYQE